MQFTLFRKKHKHSIQPTDTSDMYPTLFDVDKISTEDYIDDLAYFGGCVISVVFIVVAVLLLWSQL